MHLDMNVCTRNKSNEKTSAIDNLYESMSSLILKICFNRFTFLFIDEQYEFFCVLGEDLYPID